MATTRITVKKTDNAKVKWTNVLIGGEAVRFDGADERGVFLNVGQLYDVTVVVQGDKGASSTVSLLRAGGAEVFKPLVVSVKTHDGISHGSDEFTA